MIFGNESSIGIELKADMRLARDSDDKARRYTDKLQRVKASPEYAERLSAARLARLPRYPLGGKSCMWLIMFGLLGAALFALVSGGLCFLAWSSVREPGLLIVGCIMMVFGGVGTGVVGVSLWAWRQRLRQVEKTPIEATAAIVVDKRKTVSRETYFADRTNLPGTDRSGVIVTATWYVTFQNACGDQREFELFSLECSKTYPGMATAKMKKAREPKSPMYDELQFGAAGVLFARGNIAFDFDQVC